MFQKPLIIFSGLLISTFLICDVANAGFEWLPDGQTPYSDTPEPDPTMDALFAPMMNANMPNMSTPAMPQVQMPAAPMRNPQYQAPNQAQDMGFLPLPGQAQRQAPANQANMSAQQELSYSARRSISNSSRNMQSNNRIPMMARQNSMTNSTGMKQAPNMISNAQMQNSSSNTDLVQGFGSDMPLALALRQIIPPQYAFSFGDGVNPGLRASWTGNKPWNAVVNDMLTPLNLTALMQGKSIYITKRGASAPVKRISAARTNSMNATTQNNNSSLYQPPSSASASMYAQPAPRYRMPPPASASTHSAPVIAMPRLAESAGYNRSDIIDPSADQRSKKSKFWARTKRFVTFENWRKEKRKSTDFQSSAPTPIPTIISNARKNAVTGYTGHQQAYMATGAMANGLYRMPQAGQGTQQTQNVAPIQTVPVQQNYQAPQTRSPYGYNFSAQPPAQYSAQQQYAVPMSAPQYR